ncbi:S1 family peptidase [Bacillus pumilus]
MNYTNTLLYSTVRIECRNENYESTGTGFFYNFQFGKNVLPVIVTNKHVISGYSKGRLILNIGDNYKAEPEGRKEVDFDGFETRWIFHPDEDVDLCIFPLGELLHKLDREGQEVFYRAVDKKFIPTKENIDTLISREDILVVGYPNGIWDEFNNLPIMRDGITATHYKFNYNGKKNFLIDASIFPGSSGSPVYIYNQGYIDNRGNTYMGRERLIFIGIVYGVYQHGASGKLEVQFPTKQGMSVNTQVPNNLGIAIKSERILDFEPILQNLNPINPS